MEEEEMKTVVGRDDGNEKLHIQNPNDERWPWWQKWECLGEKKRSGGAKEEHEKKVVSIVDIGDQVMDIIDLVIQVLKYCSAVDMVSIMWHIQLMNGAGPVNNNPF